MARINTKHSLTSVKTQEHATNEKSQMNSIQHNDANGNCSGALKIKCHKMLNKNRG